MKRSIKSSLLICTIIAGFLAIVSLSAAVADDYYVYSQFNSGVGSYGVDGYVGTDGIDRIIFYATTSPTATAYIYTVTIPAGEDPNMHPDNPEATGPVAPRTYTLDLSFDLGVNPGHESEFYVDTANNAIYLGASVGIVKYVFNGSTYVFDSMIAPPSPYEDFYYTQSLGYDPDNDVWYAGAISWNNDPGVTVRKVWKYEGSQGNAGVWTLAFTYTTPGNAGTHHDGLEFNNGSLFLADYEGDYITQYAPDGTFINTFWHPPLGHELEGMGYGALTHFWCGSHGDAITEFGGGALQQDPVIEVSIDIKPWSDPNSINRKSNGTVPVAILSSESFDALEVDPETVVFAGASALPIGMSPEDANGDGYLDLVLHFNNNELLLEMGDTEACLTGQTYAGDMIEGCDSVRIVK